MKPDRTLSLEEQWASTREARHKEEIIVEKLPNGMTRIKSKGSMFSVLLPSDFYIHPEKYIRVCKGVTD